MHRQWWAPYRLLYSWAWRRKCRSIAEGGGVSGGDGLGLGLLGRLERLLFGTVARSRGDLGEIWGRSRGDLGEI